MAPRRGWKKNTLPCAFDHSQLSLPGEEWRDAIGWERFYRVSNLGRVCSLHLKAPAFVTGMKVRGGYRGS